MCYSKFQEQLEYKIASLAVKKNIHWLALLLVLALSLHFAGMHNGLNGLHNVTIVHM